VNPDFAIISASTRNHLPKATTVARYEANNNRVVLRTDDHTEADVDHIMCFKDADGKLDCNFVNVISPETSPFFFD
jgi:hypothetical protein